MEARAEDEPGKPQRSVGHAPVVEQKPEVILMRASVPRIQVESRTSRAEVKLSTSLLTSFEESTTPTPTRQKGQFSSSDWSEGREQVSLSRT